MATQSQERRLGLIQVWPTDDRTTTIDVVAVHGLDTSSPRTWVAYQDEANNSSRLVHWLKDPDMLPFYLSNARIFTYDWNANTRNDASTEYFHSHPVTFLRDLERKRRGCFIGNPILLIGSCYGGLILARAFVMAAGFTQFSDIYQSICGFIFLGTPFRGSKGTISAHKWVLLSSLLGKQSSHSLLNVIDHSIDDGRLDEVRSQFCEHALQKWGGQSCQKVVCFFETEPTKISRAVLPRWAQTDLVERGIQILTKNTFNFLLVNAESACLDGFGRQAINVRHAMLNKFRGRDGNFERLITSIGDAIGNPDLLANPPTTTNTLVSQGDIEDGKDTFTNEEKKCHALFRVSDYQWFKDRIEDRLPNTCLWFTNHPRYKAWLESQEGVLLVTADPGCGKSVLAKSLVEDELPRTSTVCYFFFKEMDQNNLALALCGLLHQLLLKRPDLIKHALRDYQANGDGMIKSVTVLWDILANACSDMRAGPIICVIDALDECLEDHMHDLSRKIDGFYRGRPGGQRNLKFLLTARPYESVTARFRILETMFPTICLRGEDESKTIGQEINIVIEHRVNKIATEKRLPPAIHQHLYNCLVAIPHRTYLWVYLVFDYIQTNIVKKTIGGIDAVIQRLPETVEAAYARLLDRCQLDARPEVRRALLVIVGAYRPLDLSEFNVAVSMVLKSSRWDEIDLEEDGEFRLRIRDWCGLFVSIYDNKAYLIHQTARDFLLAPIASTTLSPRWLHPFNIDSAMAMLAEICLAFLNLSDLSGEEKSCRNNSFTDLVSAGKPLAGYAPRYWLKHIRAVEHRSSTLHDLYDKILRNSSEFGPFWLENWLSANDNGIPLHDQQNLCKVRWTKSALKAFLGDDQGLTSELPRCVPAQKTAAELISPLFASVVGGQVATAMLLLASGADPNDTSFRDDSYLHVSLLHWISSFDYKKHDRSAAEYATVFERLVASGADIHCRHTRGLSKVTLLHSVADPELVPVICKLGADVEARDNFGRTPLHSQTGNPEVIRALLEQGANAQAVDQNGGTPLHQRGSLPQAIALLVNAGCPINAEDYCGSVALHSANSDCAEALLSLGADANWRKEDSLTPLHSVRDSETIKVLLRHGAVVDARDKTLRTPLMYSGQHLLLGKAEQLLGAGADPCVTDQNKATALHHACDAAEVYDEYEYDISKLGDILATAGVGLIELLITAGADVDAQDELGNTPLHVLCQKDGRIAKMEDVLPSVAILVTKGARTSIRNKEGKTPGDIAFDVYGQQRNFAGHFEALICHSETNEEGSRGRVTYEPPTKDGPQESVDDLLSRMEQTRLTYKDAFRRPPKLV